MKKSILAIALGVATLSLVSTRALAHCQIPCGIYDDPARFTLMLEHLTTVEKSMKLIAELTGKHDALSANQLARWVANKEQHADEFTEIVTYYFLTQRIKPAAASDKAAHQKYLRQLELLHHMMVYAMKAKQTADPAHVTKLRSLVHDFKDLYLKGK